MCCLHCTITVEFAGTSEECTVRQDELDGPNSEDDNDGDSQDVRKQNKVNFLFFVGILLKVLTVCE